jgi:hypothetical protein
MPRRAVVFRIDSGALRISQQGDPARGRDHFHRGWPARQREDASAKLLELLGWQEPRESDFNQSVRIILVAHAISKEITGTAIRLLDHDFDIRCVRFEVDFTAEQ